jgi:enoyl-CoA hydratase
MSLFTPRDLDVRRLGDPAGEAFGPGTPDRWLALDLTADASGAEGLAEWLRTLPCPVIGLGDARHSSLAAACDAVVERPEALDAIRATIAACPITAMTFVQLLRLIDGLAPEQALTAESLAYGVLQAGPEFRRWREGASVPPPFVGDVGPPVIIDRRDERLALTLNRPGDRNALSLEMRDALVEALDLAAIDDTIAEILLSAAGRCFSVGGDLREFGLAADPATAHWVRSVRSPARAVLRVANRLTAHVHGACIGAGVELPAFAARVTATRDAFFQLPELKMGLLPGSGGCVSLSRRIGRQKTALMALSGRRINSATALAWGLVDEIVD